MARHELQLSCSSSNSGSAINSQGKKSNSSQSLENDKSAPVDLTQNNNEDDDSSVEIPYTQAHEVVGEVEWQIHALNDDGEKKEPLRPGDIVTYDHPMMVAGKHDRVQAMVIETMDDSIVLDNGDVLDEGTCVARVEEYRDQRRYPHNDQFRMRRRKLAGYKRPRIKLPNIMEMELPQEVLGEETSSEEQQEPLFKTKVPDKVKTDTASKNPMVTRQSQFSNDTSSSEDDYPPVTRKAVPNRKDLFDSSDDEISGNVHVTNQRKDFPKRKESRKRPLPQTTRQQTTQLGRSSAQKPFRLTKAKFSRTNKLDGSSAEKSIRTLSERKKSASRARLHDDGSSSEDSLLGPRGEDVLTRKQTPPVGGKKENGGNQATPTPKDHSHSSASKQVQCWTDSLNRISTLRKKMTADTSKKDSLDLSSSWDDDHDDGKKDRSFGFLDSDGENEIIAIPKKKNDASQKARKEEFDRVVADHAKHQSKPSSVNSSKKPRTKAQRKRGKRKQSSESSFRFDVLEEAPSKREREEVDEIMQFCSRDVPQQTIAPLQFKSVTRGRAGGRYRR